MSDRSSQLFVGDRRLFKFMPPAHLCCMANITIKPVLIAHGGQYIVVYSELRESQPFSIEHELAHK